MSSGLGALYRSVVPLSLAALSGSPLALAQAPAQRSATAPLVIRGVTVIDVTDGKYLPAHTVVIVGNRIRAMGADGKVRIPQGAQIVDAQRKYLVPGFWDMHVHVVPSTIDVSDRVLIANGVTGFRDAGTIIPLDVLHRRRQEIVAGTRVGPPRQFFSGQSIGGPGENGCDRAALKHWPQTCVADSADAVRHVDSLKAAGADMVKPRAVTRELYIAIAAEARRLGLPFGGHGPLGGHGAEEASLLEYSDRGASLLDHIYGLLVDYAMAMGAPEAYRGPCATRSPSFALEKCRVVAERFRRNGTWFVPTLIATGTEGQNPRYSDRIYQRFVADKAQLQSGVVSPGDWLRAVTAANRAADTAGAMRLLQRLGMPILAGTDMNYADSLPVFWPHIELAMYVAEGLTPLEALQTATLNPAKMLRATDSLGTVAMGKLADLVLLDADPLADITNTTTIRAVVANGRYFDRAALDNLLVEARQLTPSMPSEFLLQAP